MFTIISSEEADEILEELGINLDWEQDLGWGDESDDKALLRGIHNALNFLAE